MAKNFSKQENHILNIFKCGETFIYNNEKYIVETSDKPTCNSGEPKTDIYILAKNHQLKPLEIKISFKKNNADFLENKTNAERAEQLFGNNWTEIISRSTNNIFNEFNNRPLIYKNNFKKTQKGSITLGWKFEILNKLSGKLSGEISLNYDQVLDVYSGTNLSLEKRNAYINNVSIPESGVANFILFEDSNITNSQNVIDSLIPIENYVKENPDVYFACKALNYRTFRKKHDGNRPLSVYVHWFVRNNKLAYELVLDKPLKIRGNEAKNNLTQSLKNLGIETTDDLNESNVEDPNIIY